MKISVPDINEVISRIEPYESFFNGKTQSIKKWICDQRNYIKSNLEFVNNKSDKNDIKVLLSLLRDYLVRAMTGEMGEKTFSELTVAITDKADLTKAKYIQALKKANYRWGPENGASVIIDIVEYFGEELQWDFQSYFEQANKNKDTNFLEDKVLEIHNIGLKVRDLALSSFTKHYAAFDLHLCRVPARIGLLNYGFDLFNQDIEMGTNPQNKKNYLFLHHLFMKLSKLTEGNYSMADFDRFFWHFGKTVCKAIPKCDGCPIRKICMTGTYR